MRAETAVDPRTLREEVKSKYRAVASNPHGEYHFHTGRRLARQLGYDTAAVERMPDAAVESFAGVANPFALQALEPGAQVVGDGWADAVISNGAICLCADMKTACEEIWRVLRPGGRLQFADIASGKIGFVDVRIGARCDAFGEASGEKNARRFEVYGDAFLARKPT